MKIITLAIALLVTTVATVSAKDTVASVLTLAESIIKGDNPDHVGLKFYDEAVMAVLYKDGSGELRNDMDLEELKQLKIATDKLTELIRDRAKESMTAGQREFFAAYPKEVQLKYLSAITRTIEEVFAKSSAPK